MDLVIPRMLTTVSTMLPATPPPALFSATTMLATIGNSQCMKPSNTSRHELILCCKVPPETNEVHTQCHQYSKISVHQPDQNTICQLCYALNYRTEKVNKIYPRIKALKCQFILECRLVSNSPEHRVKVPFQ